MTNSINTLNDEIPIVWCNVIGNDWSFWCSYCRKRHLHGGGPGHRTAHCHNSNSPYNVGGYILKDKKERSVETRQ
jgi:hypothetical protein